MTNTPDITPPPELVQQWYNASPHANEKALQDVATCAAQWGADQELEACCKVLEVSDRNAREFLYTARRPKPPSLKEQALSDLKNAYNADMICDTTFENIRRALEALEG